MGQDLRRSQPTALPQLGLRPVVGDRGDCSARLVPVGDEGRRQAGVGQLPLELGAGRPAGGKDKVSGLAQRGQDAADVDGLAARPRPDGRDLLSAYFGS